MRMRVVLELDVNFDAEDEVVDNKIVGEAIIGALHNGGVIDTIADYIQDDIEEDVLSVNMFVPEVECIG